MVGVKQMGLLVATYMQQYVINRKSNVNQKLCALRLRQFDLQNYSSAVADGSVSMNDLFGAPPTMMMRMMAHAKDSHDLAMVAATNGLPGMMAMFQANGGFNGLQPQMQQQYQQMIFKNLYDKEREKFARQEASIIAKEDKRIEQQVAQLTTELQMLEAQEKALKEQISKEAENSAPKYA